MMNKEKKIAKKLTNMLYKRGFLVKQHKSKTSKSIYLKIDNGAIPTIRISDHKRWNYGNCKYNVIRDYNGVRNEIVKGKIFKYYKFTNVGNLISDIEKERANTIVKHGYAWYRDIRDKNVKLKKVS